MKNWLPFLGDGRKVMIRYGSYVTESLAEHLKVPIAEKDADMFAPSVPSWPPSSDTVESLKELGKRGYKRVILSNINRGLLKETILKNNLDVDGYVTAEDVGSCKPSPARWSRFFEIYKTGRETTLHVAQSIYHDIIPCSKLAISTAWIKQPRRGLIQHTFSTISGVS